MSSGKGKFEPNHILQQHVYTIANVCEQAGIEHVVICPGSRSAPLVYAFASNPAFTCYSIVDERTAGFTALGMAQQLRKPVVIICTSGTASLNLFPAVAEAYYQRIPLLLLTADRPPELLNQQDGQMIMQKGVFGKHVLGSHELLCFEEGKIDFTLTERIVKIAVNETMSFSGKGPVHINVPLREPLYPSDIRTVSTALHGFPEIENYPPPLPHSQLDELLIAWRGASKRLILVGQLPPDPNLTFLLNELINREDAVILCDIASNQLHASNALHFDAILQFADKSILESLEPDLILSFGGPMVSKSLKTWLKPIQPIWHFRLGPETNQIDTYQQVTHFVKALVDQFMEAFLSILRVKPPATKSYCNEWLGVELKTRALLESFHLSQKWSEPTAMDMVLKAIPEDSQVQLSNSSVVRFASWNGGCGKQVEIFSNRGTSGIDGCSSTAVGSAFISNNQLVTLITGDLAFFYDSNAFWQNKLPSNLRIIVFNNNKGQIFEWIDGPSKQNEYLSFFSTPHNRQIANVCNEFGFIHHICNTLNEVKGCLEHFFEPNQRIALLELRFASQQNLELIKAFKSMKISE